MGDKKALHVFLDDDTHDTWTRFATENGVSASALIEARGQMLAKEIADAGDTDIHGDWVKAARKVDATRRRRGRV